MDTLSAARTPEENAALEAIEQLVHFALKQNMIELQDLDYSRNLLLEQFGFSESFGGILQETSLGGPQPIIDKLIDYGIRIGLIPDDTDTYRDLLDAKIMGQIMARPSEIIAEFNENVAKQGIQAATDRFYQLSIDSNYIRMDRVAKNVYWKHASPFGDIEMTINLSKPEKSPKEIAMAKLLPPQVYPKCQLCRENVGYAGRVNHPARQNLRVIPLEMNGEPWLFQYSPYVYYNEHCIVFHHDHVPMKLSKDSLRRLLAFTDVFPHYFIGSNADLPIVGGSILTHDHFQGGRHTFPIQHAPKEATFHHMEYPDVSVSIVKWPMSVLRLTAADSGKLLECANDLFESWKQYSDPMADIIAFSDENGVQVPHNTVTPIVHRTEDGSYEMDLVLRNNRTSEEHPSGIFHPHEEMHHIKRENIGLIEVMGLAILPGRLKEELDLIADMLAGNQSLLQEVLQDKNHALVQHRSWIEKLVAQFGTKLAKEHAVQMIQQQVGDIFVEILGHAGVYKRTTDGQTAFRRFLNHMGYEETKL
ncbi:UDP-glucose--hexose-1-phosphate uridylyltransferase [Paenibacillus pini]|uniref:Galactose-1-phosphate uridylyltransferase n=1 Tax=Paenibacillus pini JCM 16418 TaxID=1236976 RepID=W7YWW0_9BACL|nr:UDP-glucose--hexose-1-phosphate uridylyltransferase [Paenibacillus pini]GAF06864.1 galactose-1-phosphate uridylyltransferase [Paenibacillus pini JCM 16418]